VKFTKAINLYCIVYRRGRCITDCVTAGKAGNLHAMSEMGGRTICILNGLALMTNPFGKNSIPPLPSILYDMFVNLAGPGHCNNTIIPTLQPDTVRWDSLVLLLPVESAQHDL
jgi:hypothetical protein